MLSCRGCVQTASVCQPQHGIHRVLTHQRSIRCCVGLAFRYYFTIHTGVAGLDTPWQPFTAQDGLLSLPAVPVAELADPTVPQLLDVSSPTGSIIDEAGFVWKTTVVSSSSSGTIADNGPPPPDASATLSMPLSQYRVALVTNASRLLWANVAWQRDGDSTASASMSRLSSTQFLGPPVTLQWGDVLTYQLSWWDLSTNAEQRSPLTFVYRPPAAEALQLMEAAASGSSTLPGGTNLGDGQSVWGKLKQSVQASLAPLPDAPAALGLGSPSLALSSPISSSAAGSVTGVISSGLATLLSSLSALQAGPARLVSSDGQSVMSQSTSVSVLPASTATSTAGSDTLSAQSLTDLITPLALIGSLAGLTSSPGSSSLSSMSTFAGAAFCVLPCATSSPNSDVMVSCLGGCAQPFLPAGLSSSEATSVINALHDYVVTNAQSAAISSPNSLSALNQTTLQNATRVGLNGDSSGNSSGQTAGNTSSTPASLTEAPQSTPSQASITPSSSLSTGSSSPAAGPAGSVLTSSAVSGILSWLTGTQSTAAAASPLLAIPSLLPSAAAAPSGPGAALASSLSSGLGYLSTPLLAGLSSLSSSQVSIASTAPRAAGGLTLSSFGQSVTLPLSVLSALLSPLLPAGTSALAAASTVTYVAGVTCMLPCIGASSLPSAAAAGLSSASSCIGSCIDAVMPGTATGGAKLVNDIESLVRPAAPLTAASATATASASASTSSSRPLVSTAPSSSAAVSSASAALSSSSGSAVPAAASLVTASPTLSLTGSASSTVATKPAQSAEASTAERVSVEEVKA